MGLGAGMSGAFGGGKDSTKFTYATPSPGDKWWRSAERGKKIFGDYLSSMFGTSPDALSFTGGTFAKDLFGGGAGGGFGGRLGDMISGLEGSYDEAIGGVNLQQAASERGAREAGSQLTAQGTADMQRRGLGNSTLKSSFERGAAFDTQKNVQDIQAQAAALRGQFEIAQGQDVASAKQYGIEAQNATFQNLMAFLSGSGGYGPSGWNAMFGVGQPQLRRQKGRSSSWGYSASVSGSAP